MAAILACGTYPDRFRALVAVDVGLRVDTPESQKVRAFMTARPDGFADLEDAAQAVHAYNPGRTRPVSPDGLRRNLVQQRDGRWRWHWDPRMLEGKSDLTQMAARLREAAGNIVVPVLLVRGQRSQMVDDAGVAEFRALVPQLQVADIQGASHMVAGDDNDSFADAVRSFLKAFVVERE